MFEHCAIVYAIAPCIVRLAGAISAIRVGHSPVPHTRREASAMMRASVRGCASGGMVSGMSKQRQARAASALVVPVRATFDQHSAEVGAVNGAGLRFGSAVREPWDYVPKPPFVVDDDGYLISDSMGQNNRHAGRMLAYGPAMKARHRERGFVGVDLSMPYVKGSPGKMVAPDLFVALAAQQDEDRNSYKLWEEPTPDFVLEDLSRATWRKDTVDKRVLYRRLGVREYWMFEETGRRLRDDSGARLGVTLVGYRLRDGEYERIRANDAGRLPSEVLELELCVRDGLVRFHDPATGECLPTYEESRAQAKAESQRALAAEQRAEVEARRAETEAQRAEVEAERARAEQANAAAAMARVAALEAELRAKRGLD